MNGLYIERSVNTPEISFDFEKGLFAIKGRSFPENATAFYGPVLEWFEENSQTENKPMIFEFELDYISSSSVIKMLELVNKINDWAQTQENIQINWIFEEDDEDIIKLGERLKQIVAVPFNLVEN